MNETEQEKQENITGGEETRECDRKDLSMVWPNNINKIDQMSPFLIEGTSFAGTLRNR